MGWSGAVGAVWGRDDPPTGEEPRKHRSREVFSYLVETQATSLALGIPTVGAHRREMIVAVDDRGLIEVGAALGVSGDDQRVEGERDRSIALLGVLDEFAAALRKVHVAHGRRTPGTGRVGARAGPRVVPGRVFVFVRVRVVSFEGSM